ncbi:hypothetical protein HY468_03690, partial [Candidatus Roizmanbacteria bacterium]|nr:hypothetical protein [Candidatus Roizmanbacteria bacterium]
DANNTPQAVDSVDVRLCYNNLFFSTDATKVTPGTIPGFPSGNYDLTQPTTNYCQQNYGLAGMLDISAQVNTTDTTGVVGQDLLLATVAFTPLTGTATTEIKIDYTAFGDRNDSNILLFAQGTDILKVVTGGSYQIVGVVTPTATVTPTRTPTVTPTPTRTPTPIPTVGPNTPTPIPPTPTTIPPSPTPTTLPTATVTPTTRIDRIIAKLLLQGRGWPNASNSRAFRLMLRNKLTGQIIGPLSVSSATDGSIDLNTTLLGILPIGTYDIILKPEGFLQKKFSDQNLGPTNTFDFSSAPFPAGDVNVNIDGTIGDGIINAADHNRLLTFFKTNNPVIDWDGSGLVNSIDFSLMLSNWNHTGDEE